MPPADALLPPLNSSVRDAVRLGAAVRPVGGVRNNAYTNVMVAWLGTRPLEALDLLAATDCDPRRDRLALRPGEREH